MSWRPPKWFAHGVTLIAMLLGCERVLGQTADDALWVMLFGFETEVNNSQPLSQVSIQRLAQNRWSVAASDVLGTRKNIVEIVSNPNNKCKYSVDVYDENNILQQRNFFDFSKVTDYKAESDFIPGYMGQSTPITNIIISGVGLYTQYNRDQSSGKVIETLMNMLLIDQWSL